MTDYLLYWKDYWFDPNLESDGSTVRWHTAQRSFWTNVNGGDSFWVVSSGGPDLADEWRLLKKMTVVRKGRRNNVKRPYLFEAARTNLLSFSLDQPDFSPIMRQLNFASGKRITANGRRIGNAIQVARRLSVDDATLLNTYSTAYLHRTDLKTTRSNFSVSEIALCTYAAMYDAADYGGLSVVQKLHNRSLASLRLKVQNIVAMLDENGFSRNPTESALTGLPKGRQGRRTNWETVESYLALPRPSFLKECLAILQSNDLPNSESVALAKRYLEGSLKQIVVNAYERDPRARRACIDHYGPRCSVCDFDFADFYGPEGAGFIHVHHIKPLNEIGTAYEIDPVTDLVPLCPNCHAFIHLGPTTRDVEQVREKVKSRRQKIDVDI